MLDGDIKNAVVPLGKAGAELEDFGLLFKLEVPKKKTSRRRARARRASALLPEGPTVTSTVENKTAEVESTANARHQ